MYRANHPFGQAPLVSHAQTRTATRLWFASDAQIRKRGGHLIHSAGELRMVCFKL